MVRRTTGDMADVHQTRLLRLAHKMSANRDLKSLYVHHQRHAAQIARLTELEQQTDSLEQRAQLINMYRACIDAAADELNAALGAAHTLHTVLQHRGELDDNASITAGSLASSSAAAATAASVAPAASAAASAPRQAALPTWRPLDAAAAEAMLDAPPETSKLARDRRRLAWWSHADVELPAGRRVAALTDDTCEPKIWIMGEVATFVQSRNKYQVFDVHKPTKYAFLDPGRIIPLALADDVFDPQQVGIADGQLYSFKIRDRVLAIFPGTVRPARLIATWAALSCLIAPDVSVNSHYSFRASFQRPPHSTRRQWLASSSKTLTCCDSRTTMPARASHAKLPRDTSYRYRRTCIPTMRVRLCCSSKYAYELVCSDNHKLASLAAVTPGITCSCCERGDVVCR